jgi:decaprenylphospho-beta-D-erythro-pentofuranosid-2-ulose 2-reductase
VRDALGGVQSVLVLGGGSEIAQAIVRRLVAERTRTVVLAARRPERLEPFAAELRDAGAAVEAVGFEATDRASHAPLLADAAARHGDIDVVLVAFGVLARGAAEAAANGDPEGALRAGEVNYMASVAALSAAAGRLREQGHGTIVLLSSVAAVRPRAASFPYGASKAGADAFAEGLGDALAGTGVDVLVVRPGFVRTKMTAGMPDAPLATTPDVVAREVVAALARGAHTAWAPPVVRVLMAVLRALPRRLWRRVAARSSS